MCFTIFTKDRTFDFSASSSSHARAAVVAISHASGDPGGQLKRAVGSMLWMAARWHLHDRWSQRGGIVEPKKVLSDVLFECAAEKVWLYCRLVVLAVGTRSADHRLYPH